MDSLARVQALVSIASSILIPIVIALVGWWVQSSVTEAGIKKDYVAMAMEILKEGKSADPELVTWAAEVVKANSPTPLSNALRGKIISSSLQSTQAMLQLKLPAPHPSLMARPAPIPKFPIEKLKAGAIGEQEALERWANDHYAAKRNEATIRALQQYIKLIQEGQEAHRNNMLESSVKAVRESEGIK